MREILIGVGLGASVTFASISINMDVIASAFISLYKQDKIQCAEIGKELVCKFVDEDK